jgi:ABC-type nitrate/sulfonate/bicarbonate transport system permease component
VRAFGRESLLYLASTLGGLLLWELAALGTSALVLPPPSTVLVTLGAALAGGALTEALLGSLGTLALGFALAVAVGFPVGFALGRSRSLAVAAEPVMDAVYAVPPVAMVPFLVIWFGLFLEARVALIFLMALFEIVITMATGARTVDPRLVDAARSFGATRWQVARNVVVPATLPFAFTALRIGFVRALNGMITAELLLAAANIGALMKESVRRFDSGGLIALVLLLGVIGLIAQEGLKVLEARALPWHIQE